jgi:hypothetical protein
VFRVGEGGITDILGCEVLLSSAWRLVLIEVQASKALRMHSGSELVKIFKHGYDWVFLEGGILLFKHGYD